jgi:hypothetical protein
VQPYKSNVSPRNWPRSASAVLLLTVLLLITPLPLIQIVPGIIIIILAVAYLEDDGATLAFAAASAGAVWGMIAGAKWIALRG